MVSCKKSDFYVFLLWPIEIMVVHRFMGKKKEGLMVIRAFVHLIKVGR